MKQSVLTRSLVVAFLSLAIFSSVHLVRADSYPYSRNLTIGDTGADVTALQQFLINDGFLKVAAPTGYFGVLTSAALAGWQASVGLPSTGFFGPLSRAAIANASGGTTTPPPPTSSTTFTRNLTIGDTGADVTALQQFLINDGFLKVAAPTGYFGVLTSAALAAWQASVGLPSTGFFGPLSRAAIGNGVSTGGGSGTTGSSGGGNGGSSSGILPLPPTIAITFPENNSNVGNTLTVSGVASDIAGITSVTLSVDGGASTPVSGTVSWTYLLDTTTLVNGAHTITVQLTDPVGNLATASIVVLVNNGTVTGGGTGGGNPNPDTTPPSTPTGVLVTATATSTVSLSWNSSTDNVGVAGYEIFRNGVEVGTAFTNAYTDINLSPATGFSYTILAYDAAGNLSAQSTPVIGTTLALPDTTPPTITMTAPPNNSIASGTVIVSANASDNVGVASVQFLLDGIVLGVPITVPPYLVHWNTVTATTGTHLLAAVAADAAGNLKTATALTVTVTRGAPDTTPPSVPTNLTATGISTSQINLAWTASTDNVGVAGYNIFRGGVLIASTTTNSYSNTGLAASTTYSYAVSAYDAAGNTSAQSSPATGSTLAAPDTTPPTVTMTAPPNNSTASGTVIVSATASDNVGVASVQFLLDGVPLGPLLTTSPYQIFWNTLSATNGTHLLAAVAADAAGNMKTSAAITVTVVPPSDTTPPSVPTNLTATAVSFSQINLAWTASTDNVGVAGYKVFRGGTQIATTSVNSYSNTGLSSSTTYTYTVAAYDAVGNASAQSASASATTPAAPDTTPPSVPANLTATAISSSQVNLSWSASTDNVGVAGYKIFRGGVAIATTSATSYSNTGLNPSTNYSYTVSAYDATGNNSAQSTAASATTFAAGDTTPPSVPTNLTATAVSQTQINLIWTASTDNVGVTGYKVFRGGTQIATSTTNSYSNVGLNPGTNYSYTVSAYDAAGNNSAQSTAASATTFSSPDTTPPSTPTGLTASPVSQTQINLTWTASTDNVGVVGYKVNRGGVQIATTSATSYSDAGLTASTLYTYNVSAYDAAGNNSGLSTSVSTTTLSSGVDTTPPSVSITAPTQGSSVAGSVAVMVTASDNVGVTKVEFYVNNALQSTDTVTPYAFSWGTVILANGSYTLSAKAYDAAGNIGISGNVSVNVSNTSGGGGGGAFGPLYTAPTDTGTHGYSPVVDALSGVQYAGAPPENTLAEDVDFTHNATGGLCNSLYTCFVRATGPNLWAQIENNSQYNKVMSGMVAFHTDSGSGFNSWSIDDSQFIIGTNPAGSAQLVINFNSSTGMTSLNQLTPSSISGGSGLIHYSKTQAKIAYGYFGPSPSLAQIDLTQPPPAQGVVTELVNLNTACNFPFTVGNLTGGGWDTSFDNTGAGVDSRYATYIGPQNTAPLAVVWDRASGGCVWYDVASDTMGGANWPGGTPTCAGCLGATTTQGIHGLEISEDGNFVSISEMGLGTVLWKPGTTQIYHQTELDGQGHRVFGMHSTIAGPSNSANDKWIVVDSNTPLATTFGPTRYPTCCDQHNSWLNVNSTESNAFYTLSFSNGNTAAANAACETNSAPIVGLDEIDMVAMDGTGDTYRLMHVRKDWCLDNLYFYHATSGNISKDGKFAVWNSDWDGTLGQVTVCQGGTITGGVCTGTNSTTTIDYRDDVFVTEIR